jgi:hypothetical protein
VFEWVKLFPERIENIFIQTFYLKITAYFFLIIPVGLKIMFFIINA